MWMNDAGRKTSPVPSLGHQGGEEFSERGPNFLNCVQHIFPRGAQNFAGGVSPPSYGPGQNPLNIREIMLVSTSETVPLSDIISKVRDELTVLEPGFASFSDYWISFLALHDVKLEKNMKASRWNTDVLLTYLEGGRLGALQQSSGYKTTNNYDPCLCGRIGAHCVNRLFVK